MAGSPFHGALARDLEVSTAARRLLVRLMADGRTRRVADGETRVHRCSTILIGSTAWTYFEIRENDRRSWVRLSSERELLLGALGRATEPDLDAVLDRWVAPDSSPSKLGELTDALQTLYTRQCRRAPPRIRPAYSRDCPACSGTSSIRDDLVQGVYRCGSCSHLFRLVSIATWKQLRDAYDSGVGTYFDSGPGRGADYGKGYEAYEEWIEILTGTAVLKKKLRRLLRRASLERGSVVEVGAAFGYAVKAMRDMGFDALGVETSRYARRRAMEKFGVSLLQGTLATAGLRRGSVDAVAYFDVLEHVSHLAPELAAVRAVLRPSGRLLLELPNQGSLVANILGAEYLYSEHLHFFDPSTISYALTRAGFRIVTMYSEHDSYHAIQRFLSPRQSRYVQERRMGERLFVIACKA